MNNDPKYYFHLLSYLQYPFLLLGLYYTFMIGDTPENESMEIQRTTALQFFNKSLLFFGIAISFAGLQDPAKLQIKFTKRLWQNRKFGLTYLAMIFVAAVLFIALGIYGFYTSNENAISEIYLGITVMGIAFLTNLPVAIAIYENHGKTKALPATE